MHQVSLFYATSLFCHVPCFWGYTAQALMEPLWGVLLLSQWGSCTQTSTSFGPLPHPKIHHRVNIRWYPHLARDCLCLADL